MNPTEIEGLDEAAAMLAGKRIVVLTGAGCSTESGIPDYRGPETRRRARNPLQLKEFLRSEEARRRYWARGLVGFERFSNRAPNDAHRAIAALEAGGRMTGLITQNVDGLHQAAGSQNVVELHGAIAEVSCLDCGDLSPRRELQRRLQGANPGWLQRHGAAEMAPDGDADLEASAGFEVPGCRSCGGVLKPAVVFFGEGVPRGRVDRAFEMVDEADAMLVVGTSLAVYSGLRFVRRSDERGMTIVLVNLGESRGDAYAHAIVSEKAGRFLPPLISRLL